MLTILNSNLTSMKVPRCPSATSKGRMENHLCPRYVATVYNLTYVLNMLQGMVELIKEDADKGFEDLEVIDEGDALERLALT